MSLKRKILLIFGSIFAFFTIVVVILYFWIVGHAASLLTKLVDKQSDGKAALIVKSVKFNLLDSRIRIVEADISTKDSINSPQRYHITAKKITIQVESILSFILNKRLTVDSIIVSAPEINVFKYKHGPRKKISIPEEFEIVYQSLDSVLQQVKLTYFHFDSAKFNIYDRTKPGILPLKISHLNLTINNVASRKNDLNDSRFMFADRIMMEIFNQEIQFKDGLQSLKFKRLRLSTGSKTIKLDSCQLFSRHSATSYDQFDVFLDSIRISNIDFNQLVKTGILNIDSAICFNPHIKLQIESKAPKDKSVAKNKLPSSKDSISASFKKLLGDIDIRYLGVINAAIKFDSKKKEIISSYDAGEIDFSIRDLVIINNPILPIQLGQVDLIIKNYSAYKLDSLYNTRFDSIKLINDKVQLSNFSIVTTKGFHPIPNSTIKTKTFELAGINWPELIYEQRLNAASATLIQPEVRLNLDEHKSKTPSSPKGKSSSLNAIQEKFKLKHFFLVDGSVRINMVSSTSIDAEHCYADINVEKLLEERSIKNSFKALEKLSFSKVEYINPTLTMRAKDGIYSIEDSTLNVKEIKQSKTDKSLGVSFKDFKLAGIVVNEGNDFSASAVSWGLSDITINKKPNEVNKKPVSTKTDFKISLNKILGGPTNFGFNTNEISFSTKIKRLSTDKVIFNKGEKPVIKGLYIDGQPFLLNQNKTEAGVSTFLINDFEKSVLRNVTFRLNTKENFIKIVIPEIIFSTDINKDINGAINASFFELNKPVISFEPRTGTLDETKKNKKNKFPNVEVGELRIREASFINLPDNLAKKIKISNGASEFIIKNINSNNQGLKIGAIQATLIKPQFSNSKIKFIETGKELLKLDAANFSLHTGADSNRKEWAFTLNALKASDFLIHTLRADTIKQKIRLNSINLERILLNSVNIKNYQEILNNNQHFLLSKGDVIIDNGKTIITVKNLELNKEAKNISLDSFSIYPLIDRDSFMRTQVYQKEYTKFKTGRISISGVDFAQMQSDTAFVAKKITLNNGSLSLYRDKRLPFQTGIEKPMLTQLIGRIKLKIMLDTIALRQTSIEYEEFNEKTMLPGKVKFDNMRGNVTGVKNFNYLLKDSLRFSVSTLFNDVAKAKIKYAQSYTDSLSAFLIAVNISPFDLTALNPMLEPLASAKVKSGYLDTISMVAIGREHVAWGKMKMYYHDLNFAVLEKGSEVKKTFKTRVLSFMGNLIVHKKNTRGTGDVYAERLTEKGFPNYWVKILLSGVLTNTGIRSNKKQQKKYYKGIKKFQVPPITEVTIDE